MDNTHHSNDAAAGARGAKCTIIDCLLAYMKCSSVTTKPTHPPTKPNKKTTNAKKEKCFSCPLKHHQMCLQNRAKGYFTYLDHMALCWCSWATHTHTTSVSHLKTTSSTPEPRSFINKLTRDTDKVY